MADYKKEECLVNLSLYAIENITAYSYKKALLLSFDAKHHR